MSRTPTKTVRSATARNASERAAERKAAPQFVSKRPELLAQQATPTGAPQVTSSKRAMKINAGTLARMRRPKIKRNGDGSKPQENPFHLPKIMPGVVPEDKQQLTHDSAFEESNFNAAAAGIPIHGMWAEGIGFMGYPYLAMLSQRSEYRQPVEVLAEEMTRKWIDIKAEGKDKAEAAQDLNDAQERFKLRDRFRQALELDGVFGVSFIYLDLYMPDSKTPVWEDADELATPLTPTPDKIGKGQLRGFKVLDPTWMAPNVYDATNPMSDTFYKPQIWWVMGRQVHSSRLITIISRPVPDLLKPAYNFGGISLLQMMKPYVDNWLSTRQAVNDLINAFTVWVLTTNMEAVLQDDMNGAGGAGFEDRISLFADTMSNRGVMAIDKDTEELANISAPLGSLDKLQAQAQEHMAAVARIPLVKLFGITPSGLSASSDGEIRTFYDSILGMQQRVIGDGVSLCLKIIQLNETGVIDEEITHDFIGLWQLDEAGQAAAEKTRADTDAVLIGSSVISPDEARNRIAAEDGPYAGLEGDAPEPPEMPEEDSGEENDDDAKRVAASGANSNTTGANSGV